MDLLTKEDALKFFEDDHFARENGILITDISVGKATVEMKIEKRHLNASGNVMGGAIFSIADYACAAASCFGKDAGMFVTADARISYLRSSRGTKLIGNAECIRKGRTISFYKVEIIDDLNEKIAEVDETMFRVK